MYNFSSKSHDDKATKEQSEKVKVDFNTFWKEIDAEYFGEVARNFSSTACPCFLSNKVFVRESKQDISEIQVKLESVLKRNHSLVKR